VILKPRSFFVNADVTSRTSHSLEAIPPQRAALLTMASIIAPPPSTSSST